MKSIALVLLIASAYAGAAIPNVAVESAQGQLGPSKFQLHLESSVAEYEGLAGQLFDVENKASNRILEDLIINILEVFRDIVINGNDYIPPLDPLEIEHIGPFQFSVTGLRVTANIRDLRSEGLRWYVIDTVSFNPIRLTVGVHVTLPWFSVACRYDVETRILLVRHRAAGNFRLFIHRIEVGVDLRMGTNLVGGYLTLRELEIKIDVHDTLVHIDGMTGSKLINRFISNLVQSISQDIVQKHIDSLGDFLSVVLFDVINDILQDYTINDILP
ncbi:uncharacterized protein LOC131844533 [Achroia grisella]|uniref:uncharacterized protein LOC131844533 n=1 Tax=Achroia grisella TaxID=688607 RepID=UPI0027D2264B|nr:uncharacterized protein LOC131844533 [Achroia grisella]